MNSAYIEQRLYILRHPKIAIDWIATLAPNPQQCWKKAYRFFGDGTRVELKQKGWKCIPIRLVAIK